jgi:hypothetical protein
VNDLIELPPDEPPKNGVWVDVDEVIANPTEDEVDEGNRQGLTIDPDDDGDSGLIKTVFARSFSEHERAMEKAKALKQTMLEYGVPEVSIELVAGRPSDYGIWDSLFIVTNFAHHTVSRYSSNSLTPVLSLCKTGRSDLPGPLCNGYGGWDLCYRIITFGYANHSGYGGPFTVPALTAGTFVIPMDSARRYAWGTEWEGGLSEADWDRTLTNPRNGKQMTFREFMGRSHAAIQKYHEVHPNAHVEHNTWAPDRKIDRLGYTRESGLAEIEKYRIPGDVPGEWDEMATKEEIQQAIAKTPITIVNDGVEQEWALERVLRYLVTAVNAERIAKAVVAELPETAPSTGEGLTVNQVEAAVKRGVREVLGSLDNQ